MCKHTQSTSTLKLLNEKKLIARPFCSYPAAINFRKPNGSVGWGGGGGVGVMGGDILSVKMYGPIGCVIVRSFSLFKYTLPIMFFNRVHVFFVLF